MLSLDVMRLSLWLCVYTRYKFYTSQGVLCQQHRLLRVLSDSTNRHKTCRGPIFTSLLKRSSESQVTPLTFLDPESTFYCRRVKFKSNKFKPVNHSPIGGKFGGVLLHDIREKFRCYISALLHTTARLIFWQPPPVVLDGAWRTS